jgi:hypothetical protein
MPWSVKKGKGSRPWKIVKNTTGKVVGTSTSRRKALSSIRARYAAEGAKTGRKYAV